MLADDYKHIRRTVLSTAWAASKQSPVQLIESTVLAFEACFYPKLSREGQKAIKDNPSFVLCQLNHYEVSLKRRNFLAMELHG